MSSPSPSRPPGNHAPLLMLPGADRAGLRMRAWWIAGVYAVAAVLWIYFSDHALGLLIHDQALLLKVSVYKGFAFVAVTAILLLVVLRQVFGAIAGQQAEIIRLQRLYAAHSQINQSIVWSTSREELFARVCRVLTEYGGIRLAWIGWNDPATHRLTPVAIAGAEADYVANLEIYTDERPEGQGPLGRTFRLQQPYVTNNLLTDPALRLRHAELRRRNLRSAAYLPVRDGDQPGGVLAVYANEADFFRQREVELLTEATTDLAFGLDNLRRDEERRRNAAEVERERSFSNVMIDCMPGILFFFDTAGRFLRWNRNFEAVSGYAGAEIARMSPLDFFPAEDKPLVEAGIAEVFAQGESSVEAAFVSKDGTQRLHYFTGREVDYGGKPCLVGVGIDISARRQAEQALRNVNATLERKVSERTTELQSALARAESADRIKSAFLATMSHELRTPLNSIIGFTGIILQELAGPLNPEQTKQLGMVRNSARHLLDLINDVLDISKIESGQLRVSAAPFHLAEAIERAVATVRPLADKKGLELSATLTPGLDEMVGDRRRVEQVLLNLLNNAIKFTDRGRVTLAARVCGEGCDRCAVIDVTDTGIGIKPEDMPELFQPFRQIDSGLARLHEGTGLGLAICRRLVTLMGGTIDAVSDPAQGSTFTVRLPLQPTSPNPISA